MATQPFRFLDLPTELRFIVYEQIDFTTKHHTLESTNAPDNSSNITFVRKSLPVQILATCQLINNEAKTFLRPKLAELQSQPMRFLVDCASAKALVDLNSPLVRSFGLEERDADPRQYRDQPSGSLQSSVQQQQMLETIEEQDEDREPLSVEAKAFIARCATAWSRLQSATVSTAGPSDVEIFLTDLHENDFQDSRELTSDIWRLSRTANIAIVVTCAVKLKRFCRGWEYLKEEVGGWSQNGRASMHLLDGPSAEKWRED
jgi:hypothetical protein